MMRKCAKQEVDLRREDEELVSGRWREADEGGGGGSGARQRRRELQGFKYARVFYAQGKLRLSSTYLGVYGMTK